MATFLLVDDDPALLKLMARMLPMSLPDCEVLTAHDGPSGLELAFRHLPDVVMLDVTLPGMSGLDVCQKLKTDPRTARIPILMVTGNRTETSQRLLGTDAGADGYLYKPFVPDEFAAQIKAMLRIKQAEDKLLSQKEALEKAFHAQTIELQRNREALQKKVEELEAVIQRQMDDLVRADRLASVGILAAGIAHEVNNPNTFIASNLQTFKLFWQRLEEALLHCADLSPEQTRQVAFIREEMPKLIKGMEEGSRRIAGIVSGIKSYASGSAEQYRVVDMEEVVRAALQLTVNQLKHDIDVRVTFEPALPKIMGSEPLLCQVFVNFLLNAAHAMKEYRGEGVLQVRGYADPAGQVVVAVQDNGPGIPPGVMKHLFNPFFTTRRDKGGTGLGLFVSHGIIKGHNGTIKVETEREKGTTFVIKIPAIDKNQAVEVDIVRE